MSVYVSLPQIPLTLKFEEPLDEVVAHFQELVGGSSIHRYDIGDGEAVLVNYAVIASMTFREGARTLEVGELNRGLAATIRP